MKRSEQKVGLKHRERVYPVIVQEEALGGYWVSCPTFEGCYSQGKTVEEALQNAKEAIELCRNEATSATSRHRPSDVSLHLVQV